MYMCMFLANSFWKTSVGSGHEYGEHIDNPMPHLQRRECSNRTCKSRAALINGMYLVFGDPKKGNDYPAVKDDGGESIPQFSDHPESFNSRQESSQKQEPTDVNGV